MIVWFQNRRAKAKREGRKVFRSESASSSPFSSSNVSTPSPQQPEFVVKIEQVYNEQLHGSLPSYKIFYSEQHQPMSATSAECHLYNEQLYGTVPAYNISYAEQPAECHQSDTFMNAIKVEGSEPSLIEELDQFLENNPYLNGVDVFEPLPYPSNPAEDLNGEFFSQWGI